MVGGVVRGRDQRLTESPTQEEDPMATDNATYAIVKTGGKQYKVAVGDIVKVEIGRAHV